MAKRLTDTDKWKKRFLRDMKAPYKLLWFYILDECDHAGIWEVDFEVAQIKIGEEVWENQAIKAFKNKIFIFDDGKKWFIPDFIEFQYAEVLDTNNRVHKSVISRLEKYGLYEVFTNRDQKDNKAHTSPILGAKDKYIDKDKVKDKEEGGVGETKNDFGTLESENTRNFNQLWHFDQFFKDYPKQIERGKALAVYCVLVTNKGTHDRVMKALENYRAHLRAENSEKVWKKPKNPDTWLEGWSDWENYVEPEKELTDEERDARILAKHGFKVK